MICIDSDCLIDFLRNKPNAVKAVQKYKEELITTEINRFQILFGIYDKKIINEKELQSAKEFFSSLEVFPFDEDCGEEAAKILVQLRKNGQEIEESDCFIAASIKKQKCNKILTGNTKHFKRIEDIEVLNY